MVLMGIHNSTYSAVRCSKSISLSSRVLSLSSYSKITPDNDIVINIQKRPKRELNLTDIGCKWPARQVLTRRIIAQQKSLQLHFSNNTTANSLQWRERYSHKCVRNAAAPAEIARDHGKDVWRYEASNLRSFWICVLLYRRFEYHIYSILTHIS